MTHAAPDVDPTPTPQNLEALQKPLEQFRAKTKRLKTHPTEMLLLWVVAAHVVFLPWALGGMREWGQWLSLGLALVGFVLALIPRDYTEEHSGSNAFRLIMWPRLTTFPLFWLGLALLGLVTAQALNPAWIFVTDEKVWWMQAVPHTTWLPSGVRVPFERWGPWRMLIIYAATWLTVCAIWVGFTRRRSVLALFIVIAANGLGLVGLGIAQKTLSPDKMFWFWQPPAGASVFASFIYKNHAGNYLYLVLAVTCGQAAWHYLRGLRRLEKSNPAGVLAFCATCLSVGILVSFARGATLITLVFLCGCIGVFIVHQLLMPSTTRKPIIALVLVLIFGLFLKTGMEALNTGEAWSRLRRGVMGEDTSLSSRRMTRTASLDMAKEYWVKGAGAGSFRFLFSIYQQHYPTIYRDEGGRQMVWEHAHDDLLEIPIEQGLAGTVLVLAAVVWLVASLVRGFFWQNPLSGCIVFGTALLVVQAWWDFPFQCPAILMLWWSLLVLATMWTRFEEVNLKE